MGMINNHNSFRFILHSFVSIFHKCAFRAFMRFLVWDEDDDDDNNNDYGEDEESRIFYLFKDL